MVVADRPTSAASALTVREQDLRLRPIQARVSDLLRVAPGLITIQHAGGGKATQYRCAALTQITGPMSR